MIAAGVLAVAAAGYANTDPNSLGSLWMNYSGPGPTQAAYVYLDGKNIDAPYNRAIYTGMYMLQLHADSAATPVTGDPAKLLLAPGHGRDVVIGGFCTDILQDASTAPSLYNIYVPSAAPVGAGNTAMGTAKAQDLGRLFYAYGHSGFTADQAAAFQACVWEIVYETPGAAYDVTSGRLRLDPAWGSGWTTTANIWLGSLKDITQVDPDVRVLVSDNFQDFSVTAPGLGTRTTVVPEPLTMLGVFFGVSGLAGYLRKRRMQ